MHIYTLISYIIDFLLEKSKLHTKYRWHNWTKWRCKQWICQPTGSSFHTARRKQRRWQHF